MKMWSTKQHLKHISEQQQIKGIWRSQLSTYLFTHEKWKNHWNVKTNSKSVMWLACKQSKHYTPWYIHTKETLVHK